MRSVFESANIFTRPSVLLMTSPRYIAAITTDPWLETTFLFMDGGGLGVTLKKRLT